MTTPISIAIAAPYVTINEYSRLTGMNPRTVRQYVHEGKLPVRKKEVTGKASRSTVLINMVALTLEGAKAFNPELNV